jgi:CheY-like chemotaxis protein
MIPDGRGLAIVLAEDDADDRMLVSEALEESGVAHDIRFVFDGEDLMDYLHRRDGYASEQGWSKPNLILLDLKMPRKSGLEALQEIKSDPELRSIPVVVLTTSRAEEDIYRSYHLGVNSFISKPSSFQELVEVMKTLGHYWRDTVELPPSG